MARTRMTRGAHMLGGVLGGVLMVAPSAGAGGPDACRGGVTRAAVVSCALAASPAVRAEERGLEALAGRRAGVDVVLPSNPSLGLTIGRRQAEPGAVEPSGTTWSASLSQEIEIAGQRGARRDEVRAAEMVERHRVMAVRRETAAAALAAYYDAIAASEQRALAERLLDLGRALGSLARGRAEAGLGSAVEAELADAAALRLAQARLAAERRVVATSSTLTVLLGGDPTRSMVRADGELEPPPILAWTPGALAALALDRRADVKVADAEREVEERRASVLRRARIPNPTLSVFAQSDRANERIFGAGLSLPLPLPAPLGRTHAGEIAEAESLARRAEAEGDRVRRAVLLEVAIAAANVASRRQEVLLFAPERRARAEEALSAIARELEARRLPLRDALFAEQTLIELLESAIEARRQLCLAATELARASGADLTGSAP